MIVDFLRKLKFIFSNVSYSQAGEDAIVRFLFGDFGQKKIAYLDIGANKPDYGNNTYYFYKRNSTGVCVEANPDLCNQIRKQRKRDVVLNYGISIIDNDTAPFYIFNEPAISTFDLFEAEKREKSGRYKLLKTVNVKLKSINSIISDNFSTFPDYLSIDIEGLDYDVIKSLDVEKYPIPVICVETCVYSENHVRPKDTSLIDLLKAKGYDIYADTYINTIFVNRKWFLKSF